MAIFDDFQKVSSFCVTLRGVGLAQADDAEEEAYPCSGWGRFSRITVASYRTYLPPVITLPGRGGFLQSPFAGRVYYAVGSGSAETRETDIVQNN